MTLSLSLSTIPVSPTRYLGHVIAYLFGFVIGARDITPFFDDSAEVDAVERYVHLADLIVLREPVKVVDGEH